ncbi:hypothetical protein TNIN_484341 [Trichonephila inaurata madagascariensis]|uniref:Uncharacterized protein n=1 Tax=Trichonephila inaurata madagascariensis TaxID=2747483 RepID=A0A8X6IRL7_9ARAC|nr:hypothetical protein TNIN_484341 [Trichonephila inaurata madagascariensis]
MLLGYADASESAYRAVVYMHSVKEDGTTTTKLIAANLVSHQSRSSPFLALNWQNPADIISRGVNPEELSSWTLWWNGPQHLDISEQFIEPSITSSGELYM